MAVSAPPRSITELQDLFYRSKFAEILAELERVEDLEPEAGALDAERVLIKANALFELHRVADAKKTLRSLSQRSEAFDENYLYALARVSYLDDDATEAMRIFTEIHNTTLNERHKFKSLLGVANAHYSLGEYAKLPPIINKLCSYEPLDRDDERISLMFFLGNFYFASGASADLAKQYYKKALSASARNTWTYFIVRSLYFIATICESEGQTSELMWTLDILQSFVDESEQLFFSHVVNEKFKGYFSINTPMEFDTGNKRIMIKSSWVPFHDKPLLFQFLLLLHATGDFVGKESIARDLWPHEDYKPRVHDPRIFDIAKRARNIIEAYENQPIVLLSGRMGYKLASM
jgi:tetratricopeptide (TPR) repeat protein